MTAKKKLAQRRLTLLQVAEKLLNVSEACRRQGVSLSQFYEYKRAFQEKGFDGLMDRPPIPKTFSNETAPEVKKKFIELSLEHPAWGPVHISDRLHLQSITVSPGTVRNIWLKENIETKYKRLLRLEQEKNGKDVDLTEEQIKILLQRAPRGKLLSGISAFTGYIYGLYHQGYRPYLPPGCCGYLRFLCLWEILHLQAS